MILHSCRNRASQSDLTEIPPPRQPLEVRKPCARRQGRRPKMQNPVRPRRKAPKTWSTVCVNRAMEATIRSPQNSLGNYSGHYIRRPVSPRFSGCSGLWQSQPCATWVGFTCSLSLAFAAGGAAASPANSGAIASGPALKKGCKNATRTVMSILSSLVTASALSKCFNWSSTIA